MLLASMLKAWSAGDASALDQLTPVVYDELYRLARRNFARERDGHLLQRQTGDSFVTITPDLVVTPEPGSVLLLGSAAIGLGLALRRRARVR